MAVPTEFVTTEPVRCTTLDGVTVRMSSPRFVGRRRELSRLETIWKAGVADDVAATVVVGGEAGVGKSRLVDEFASHLAPPALVVVGQCLELVDRALPFAPIVQVLRSLHRELDPPTRAAVFDPARDEVGRLLPELHGTAHDVSGAPGPTGALFEQMLGIFERLGARSPTLVVLEDLHWADTSTRELFVFLARNLRDVPLVVLGTYRTDELHRRHPLRAVLTELDRSGSVERFELERFDRDETGELVGAILGRVPEPDLVDRTFTRSDGNAFFLEELLAGDAPGAGAMPATLRDIVLGRVDALSEPSQHVVRCAAVVGRSTDHRVLVAIAGLSEPDLLAAVREAVAQQVLLTDDDGYGYRFRHALVREAVEDDLLPGDRVALHTRVAEQLGAHPEWFNGETGRLTAEIACHWDAARNPARALEAAVAAARAAEQMYAYSESLAHMERALGWWSVVPDAEARTGFRFVDALRFTAVSADLSGRADRALDFVRAALGEVDPALDPITAGLLHERCARYLWATNSPTGEILDQCEAAVQLVPDEPTPARARVLATLGQQLMLAGRNGAAIGACERAIAVATVAGDEVTEGHARNTLGSILSETGRFEDGLAQLHRARELALATRAWPDVARVAVNESAALAVMGRQREAIQLALDGVAEARAHGLDRTCGIFLRLNAGESLWRLGRTEEHEEQLRDVELLEPVGVDVWRFAAQRAMLAIARDDLDEAREYTTRVVDVGARDLLLVELLEIMLAIAEHRPADALAMALAAVQRPVEAPCPCSDVGLDVVLHGCAAGAAVPDAAGVDALAAELARWVDSDRWGGGRPGDLDAVVAQVEAERRRAGHHDDGPVWCAVAERWAEFEMRPREAYARLRAAEAFLAAGDRVAAEAEARRSHALAEGAGWTGLRDAIVALARRARLDLGVAATDPGVAAPFGLTPRELDVLALLAAGRTNRQIAEQLFISSKTASVHVSNILGKVGAANRGEAAATARRLGLDLAPADS